MKKIVFVLLMGSLLMACKREEGVIIKMYTSLGDIRLRLFDETVLHRENMIKLVREGYYNGMLFHRVIEDFMIQAGDPESRMARPGMVLGDKDAGYTLKAEVLPQYFHRKGALAAARESDNINPERNSSGSHFYIVQGKKFSPEELVEAVDKINNRRYTALFNRLKAGREGEIARLQLVEDYEGLMRVNRELSETTRELFEQVKLVLSEEQKEAYTTVGGTPHLDGEYTVFGEVVSGLDVVDMIAAQKTDDNCRPEADVVINKMEIE